MIFIDFQKSQVVLFIMSTTAEEILAGAEVQRLMKQVSECASYEQAQAVVSAKLSTSQALLLKRSVVARGLVRFVTDSPATSPLDFISPQELASICWSSARAICPAPTFVAPSLVPIVATSYLASNQKSRVEDLEVEVMTPPSQAEQDAKVVKLQRRLQDALDKEAELDKKLSELEKLHESEEKQWKQWIENNESAASLDGEGAQDDQLEEVSKGMKRPLDQHVDEKDDNEYVHDWEEDDEQPSEQKKVRASPEDAANEQEEPFAAPISTPSPVETREKSRADIYMAQAQEEVDAEVWASLDDAEFMQASESLKERFHHVMENGTVDDIAQVKREMAIMRRESDKRRGSQEASERDKVQSKTGTKRAYAPEREEMEDEEYEDDEDDVLVMSSDDEDAWGGGNPTEPKKSRASPPKAPNGVNASKGASEKMSNPAKSKSVVSEEVQKKSAAAAQKKVNKSRDMTLEKHDEMVEKCDASRDACLARGPLVGFNIDDEEDAISSLNRLRQQFKLSPLELAKIIGLQVKILSAQGHTQAKAAQMINVSRRVATRDLSIYELIGKLPKMRFYEGSLNQVAAMAHQLPIVAAERKALESWKDGVEVECPKVEKEHVFPVDYLLGRR